MAELPRTPLPSAALLSPSGLDSNSTERCDSSFSVGAACGTAAGAMDGAAYRVGAHAFETVARGPPRLMPPCLLPPAYPACNSSASLSSNWEMRAPWSRTC
eukprot:6205949-Pleurochrysis_carterae.AAC.1